MPERDDDPEFAGHRDAEGSPYAIWFVLVACLAVILILAARPLRHPPAPPIARPVTTSGAVTIFVLCDLTPEGRIENCRQAAPVGVRPS